MRYPRPILSGSSRETFWRTLQTFCITRCVIAVLLLAYVVFSHVKGSSGALPLVGWRPSAVYLLLALGFLALGVYWRRRFMLQLMVQIAVDLVAISLLYIAAGGASTGLAILYLFPLAGAAILAPLLLALFFVSVVTLIMLADSGYHMLYSVLDPSVSSSQVGLYGAAFFAAIYLINRLAAKLIKQEELAAQRGRDLQLQEAINRLVVADMSDGVLVVDARSQVFAANPAAERMLGLSLATQDTDFRLSSMPALSPIADAYFSWRNQEDDSGSAGVIADSAVPSYVTIKPDDARSLVSGSSGTGVSPNVVVHLKLRCATVKTAGLVDDRTVIFLQDVSEIENKAQELKLASMGRLTASIAHEVRNPLSAISHAASLLGEDIADPSHLRLLRIINDNVVRLNRMVEDILRLSRKAQAHPAPLPLAPFLTQLAAEFREMNSIEAALIQIGDAGLYQVRFDPLHLREVLVNLLTNAMRYASGGPGSIRVDLAVPKPNRVELYVQDDGPAISPEVRAHLFEPFYTTSSKGTGLGLYLARELCLNNGAMLDYEYLTDGCGTLPLQSRGRFVITFAALDRHLRRKTELLP